MFRFSIRELVLLTLVVALGCNSSTTNSDSSKAPAPSSKLSSPTGQITAEQAIAIVRDSLSKLDPASQFECKASMVGDEYRVFVQFFVLDDDGNRRYFPGGHSVYVLSKSGEVLKVIGGV